MPPPSSAGAPGRSPAADDLPRLRRLLLGLLLAGMLGTAAELALLEHTEGTAQLVPFFALGAGVASLTVVAMRPDRVALRAFQAVMWASAAGGLAGSYLHLQGNAEFELERTPSLAGARLLWTSLHGATPALAPMTLTLLGLLGLACTYRHPGLARAVPAAEPAKEER